MTALLIDWLRERFWNRGRLPDSEVRAGSTSDGDQFEPPLKFEQRPPRPQNEIDIFAGRWASDLSDIALGTVSGKVRHFSDDRRPVEAMKALGAHAPTGDLRILELGPLEAGHTYQFEKMGVGEIVAIEANVEAYLKCLIVKNIANLRNARFLFGDIVEYLKEDKSRYDFIFCCGVLYHMQDPLQLIELMAARTDRIYLWTHYFTEEARPGLRTVDVKRGGEAYVYHQLAYENMDAGTFWGGNKPVASFLSRDDIVRAFRQHGFTRFQLHEEDLRHPAGPCLSISFWRG